MTENAQSEQQRTVESRSCCQLGIGIEVVLDTVSKEKLIADYLLGAIENGLAGEEPLSRQSDMLNGGRCSRTFVGSHFRRIGAAPRKLHSRARSEAPCADLN